MSSCAGDVNTGTIFTEIMSPFPFEEGEKIPTVEFLEAAKGVVAFVDKLGKVFAPVRYDMTGNIIKLTVKYEENQEKYKFIEDMILHERDLGELRATDALQWLRRGLNFLLRFFQCVLADIEEKGSFSSFMKIAYSETLEPYHGWMGSQLFNIMCRFVPSRKEFYEILSMGQLDRKDDVLKDMDNFVTNLAKCVKHLVDFYTEYNLERFVRV